MKKLTGTTNYFINGLVLSVLVLIAFCLICVMYEVFFVRFFNFGLIDY